MAIGVRRATLDDMDWLLDQLKLFSSYYGTKLSLFGGGDHPKQVMTRMIQDHVVFIAELDESHPVGLIAGTLGVHPFNPSIRVLSETFWWVDEKYRGSRAGFLLLDAFVDYGRIAADWVTMALEHRSPVKETTLTKRGFVLHERSFLMEAI